MPQTPAFRVASGEISQLSYGISDDALNKNVCAREETYFLYICATLVILKSILNALTHIYYITILFWSPIDALHGIAVRAIQC